MILFLLNYALMNEYYYTLSDTMLYKMLSEISVRVEIDRGIVNNKNDVCLFGMDSSGLCSFGTIFL